MDKNIIIIHLESLNNVIYRLNSHLFPNLTKLESESISFTKYFSTATSTLMVLSDLAYGGTEQYEQCKSLIERPSGFIYNSSLFDDLNDLGYECYICGCPRNLDMEKSIDNRFFGNKSFIVQYDKYTDFYNAIKDAISSDQKYVLYAINSFSNIGLNTGICINNNSFGTKRWSDGYRLLDDMIGRIVDVLIKTQQMDNTIIICYGDHGDDYWGHGFHQGLTHAIEPNAALIHTPLMIRGCNSCNGDRQISHSLLSTIDLRKIIFDFVSNGLLNINVKNELVYSRNLFAGQSVKCNSFNKGYSVTDGKFLLLVTNNGLEMYDIEMDPTCNCNFLDFFIIEQDILKFNGFHLNDEIYHFGVFMDDNEKRYIRQKFYFLKNHLKEFVVKKYQIAGRQNEMDAEMKFDVINSLF